MEIIKSSYENIKPLRKLFLKKINAQVRYDSCHWRGWADQYLFKIGSEAVGYGSIKGREELKDRDTVFEVYVLPEHRELLRPFFTLLLNNAKVEHIECQTNDDILTPLMSEFGTNVYSEVLLFELQDKTNVNRPELHFRKREPGDDVFGKSEADIGAYVLEQSGEIVADGGFLTHYNKPFVDLYMEVAKEHRQKGYASYILHEISKMCLEQGQRPVARCNCSNPASRGALLKAGFRICGCMLQGNVVRPIKEV